MIKEMIRKLDLPKGRILFLHVRLKGISKQMSYAELSRQIINDFYELYDPKTILIPVFTYSFTKSGLFDRMNSPSEVGRFSEESRSLFSYQHRTVNPVFNVIDTENYLSQFSLEETSAFEKGSMFEWLHQNGHIIVSINIDDLIGTYLHFLESKHSVPYRFNKMFKGEIIVDEGKKQKIDYNYYVRELDIDTNWRRKKIISLLEQEGARKSILVNNISLSWSDSKKMDEVLGRELEQQKDYLITE